MKLSKIYPALILILLLIISAAGSSFASRATEKLEQGDKQVAKAEASLAKAKKSDNKLEKEDFRKEAEDYYKDALKDYNEVAGKYAPEGAEALYKTALVHRDSPGKTGNLYQSHQILKNLISKYDKDERVLRKDLSRDEVGKVQQTVADAKELDEKIKTELNEQNKKKILYKIMDVLVHATGAKPGFSYWFAVILVTVIIKLLVSPLSKKQFKEMKKMQSIAPKIKEIQEKYKGDQKTIGEKTMALYKEHGVNPFASCLPLLIQMPVLMLLYYMIRTYEFEFHNGLFLWIGSGLSHIWSINVPNFMGTGGTVWLTARNLAEPDLILVVLYLISMYVSTRISAVDPSQADQQKMMAIMMPVMFAFIFAGFPSAFLLYWLVFNLFQIGQQYISMRAPEPAVEPAGGPATEDKPTVRRRRRR